MFFFAFVKMFINIISRTNSKWPKNWSQWLNKWLARLQKNQVALIANDDMLHSFISLFRWTWILGTSVYYEARFCFTETFEGFMRLLMVHLYINQIKISHVHKKKTYYFSSNGLKIKLKIQTRIMKLNINILNKI